MNFKLQARINRSDAHTLQQALDQTRRESSVTKEGDEFVVEAEIQGASAKELNRTLLSALIKVRSGQRSVRNRLPAAPPSTTSTTC